MTAREAAVAAVLAEHRFHATTSVDSTPNYGWCVGGDDWATKHISAHEAHVAAAIIAALDTPGATPGAYPCCGECGPGCSGHHERPCRCQEAVPEPFDVKAEAKALFKAHTELTKEGLA